MNSLFTQFCVGTLLPAPSSAISLSGTVSGTTIKKAYFLIGETPSDFGTDSVSGTTTATRFVVSTNGYTKNNITINNFSYTINTNVTG